MGGNPCNCNSDTLSGRQVGKCAVRADDCEYGLLNFLHVT